jgi:hypothetical protein
MTKIPLPLFSVTLVAECTDIVMLPNLTDGNIRKPAVWRKMGLEALQESKFALVTGYVVVVCCEVKDCIISRRNKSQKRRSLARDPRQHIQEEDGR